MIGRRISLDDGPYVVVGILPQAFHFPTLQPIDPLDGRMLVAIAARFGALRLIDNVLV